MGFVDGPLGSRMGTRYAEWLKPRAHRLIAVASRTQGLIVAAGNPKEIRGVADLVRDDVRIVNRQKGSGTRALLEYLVSEAGIDRTRINGYQNEEFTHAAVAALIAGGQADAGFAVEAAASQFRLGFVALATVRLPSCLTPRRMGTFSFDRPDFARGHLALTSASVFSGTA